MTNEQRQIRTGKFCASSVWKLMGAKGLGKTGETYIHEVAAEYLTGQPAQPEFSSAATSWGKDHEDEAREYYKAACGLEIIKGETITNDLIVGTPDGFIKGTPTGVEIKCPYNSGNHLKNLKLENAEQLKALHDDYYWQIIAYMWLANLDSWKYCSYDPRFKEPEKRMMILNIFRNAEDEAKLIERLKEAHEIKSKLVQ